jgi:hypothetical protein
MGRVQFQRRGFPNSLFTNTLHFVQSLSHLIRIVVLVLFREQYVLAKKILCAVIVFIPHVSMLCDKFKHHTYKRAGY